MLVLTRKLGESITIAGGIEITVLRFKGQEVRIGISAPPDTKILRSELTRETAEVAGE